jgi:hypothetical protein
VSLLVLALAYLAALGRWPRAWLLVLPLASVALDLVTWTGRFLFNELDALFLVTLGLALLLGRLSLATLRPQLALLPLLAYAALLCFGLEDWRVFLFPPGAVEGNPYYLPEYGYKLLRGVLWGLLLAPLWLAQYRKAPRASVDALLAGACLAALVLTLVVLWERGTLGVLLAGNAWYHVVNSLLDLSASYRVTGIFSDMHTGGEVLDGMIVLLLPLTLHALVHWRRPAARGVAALATAGLAWCTLVGFTRTTYVAVAIVCVVYAAWLASLGRFRVAGGASARVALLLALPLAAAAGLAAFRLGGSYALAAFAGLQGVAYLAGRGLSLRWLLPAVAALLSGALWAHASSRWVTPSPAGAVLLAALLAGSAVATRGAQAALANWREGDRVLATGALVAVGGVVALALGGYQFSNRMESVGRDFDTRHEHWSRVVESGGDGWRDRWLGNGVGSFPRHYLATFPDTVADVGSFAVRRDAGGYLRLGAGSDLAFGQRVRIEPATTYRFTAEVRSDTGGRLVVFLCERNLIFASNFMAACAAQSLRIPVTGDSFTGISLDLSSARVGLGPPWARWPTLLYMKNLQRGTVIDLRTVDLLGGDQSGLRNGLFRAGTDHWFFYNDFAHLPWHVKNTPLQVWFETGWLGLAAFLAALCTGLFRASRHAHAEPLLAGLGSAIIGLLLIGIFGTPMDSVRVSWLFFFFLAVATAGPRGRAVA